MVPTRSTSGWLVAPLVGATFLAAHAPVPTTRVIDRSPVAVIVQVDGDGVAARRAVLHEGGSVGDALPLVSAFAATVPAESIERLRRRGDVDALTLDRTVRVAEQSTGPGGTELTSVVADEVGVVPLRERGVTGDGVGVALIDTGVTPVDDIAGRLLHVEDPTRRGLMAPCANFSGEPTCDDTYGHGTFLAGLVAGSGSASGGRFTGIAPGASIVSAKVAGRDGSTDVSTILAAIQWVVSFRERYGIRVLNLSLGTDSRADYRRDPLNLAVQRAWQSGITVVVAASNRGPNAQTISKPGDDPFVITVGAIDDQGTASIDDDRLPRFTGRGPTSHQLTKPDLVAPGGRVVSLVAPDSEVERATPSPQPDYRRGSGTSMSAAIVSGVAALVHDAQPAWTPGQLKYALMTTARRVASNNRNAVGAGLVDADGASRVGSPLDANRGLDARSDGTGSLDESRGAVRVTRSCDAAGRRCEVAGDGTAHGGEWQPTEYASTPWTGTSWYESQWVASWNGTSWYGGSWYGNSWYGASWYGSTTDDTHYGRGIGGSSWYGVWK